MTTQELLELAAKASPELFEKTAFELKLLERFAPEFAEDVVEDFRKIASQVEGKTKEAVDWSKVKTWGGNVGSTAAQAVVLGLGMAAVTDLYNAARRGLTSGRNWKRMLEANPNLKEGGNVADVRRSFKTVQHYAPDIAADPMAAGSLVYRMVHAPIGDHDKLLRDTIQIQKDHMQSLRDPFKSAPKVTYSPTNIEHQYISKNK